MHVRRTMIFWIIFLWSTHGVWLWAILVINSSLTKRKYLHFLNFEVISNKNIYLGAYLFFPSLVFKSQPFVLGIYSFCWALGGLAQWKEVKRGYMVLVLFLPPTSKSLYLPESVSQIHRERLSNPAALPLCAPTSPWMCPVMVIAGNHETATRWQPAIGLA